MERETGALERAKTVVGLDPRFDSSPVHSGLPPPSLFWLDLVLPVSRFLVVGFTENDSEGGEVGFSKILCRRELQLWLASRQSRQ